MTRRARGEGGLRWDQERQRWIATKDVGYDGRGKRIVRKGTGRTQAEARKRLKEVLRDYEDGLAVEAASYTVKQAVEDWLTYGLGKQGTATVRKYRIICRVHIIPLLGARKLRDLTTREVEAWLLGRSKVLSTEFLHRTHGCLNRAVRRAMAQDLVRRNLVDIAEVPRGREGRPSRSLTPAQVDAVLTLTVSDRLHNYLVLSLLTGARTEELRALRWEHVHLHQIGSGPLTLRCGDRCARMATPRLGSRDGLWLCRPGASMPCGSSERCRRLSAWRPVSGGRTRGSCSPPASERAWMPPTCGVRSEGHLLWCRACRPMNGRRGSCGTRSSLFSQTPAFPSRKSRDS